MYLRPGPHGLSHRLWGWKGSFRGPVAGESLAMIPALILNLSGRISRRAALLKAFQSTRPKAPMTWPPSPGFSDPWKML